MCCGGKILSVRGEGFEDSKIQRFEDSKIQDSKFKLQDSKIHPSAVGQ